MVPGGPRGAQGKPGAGGRGAPPPPDKNKGPVARAGKFFEVRKGRSADGSPDQEEEDDGGDAPSEIALPRSITQEQEQADLKRRLNRDEILDIDKRHQAVKMVGVSSGPSLMKRRSSGIWVLILVVVAVVGLFFADKYHLLKPAPPTSQPTGTAAPG